MRIDGPTPNGGAYAELIQFDADGNPTDDKKKMVTAEAVEFDAQDHIIGRTYLVTDPTAPLAPPVDDDALDAALAAAPGPWDPNIRTFEQLWDYLGAADMPFADAREKIALLGVLPGWVNAPTDLRAEVNDWLVATRPTA